MNSSAKIEADESEPNLTRKSSLWKTLWGHLRAELALANSTGETLENEGDRDAIKRERVNNFLQVPMEIERLMLFGYLVCFDAFLYLFTVLPMRAGLAVYRRRFTATERCDWLKLILLVGCSWLLLYLDPSRLYHSIRGQSVIKLYVIFNVLEIGDRLCCSFGQDILDSLFSEQPSPQPTATASSSSSSSVANSNSNMNHGGSKPSIRPITHFLLALAYVFGHTLVYFYQVITLNVAINSHNNALLTLLISNQFVEIKGSVFKKFEKENLFQLSCSDIVERFQISVFLLIISMRNMMQLTTTDWFSLYLQSPLDLMSSLMSNLLKGDLTFLYQLPLDLSHFLIYRLPQWISSWLLQPFTFHMDISSYMSLLDALVYPALVVYGSEMIVDWLKHAFITKFNQIRPTVYARYLDILCKDLALDDRAKNSGNTGVDRTALVARRIGFASIPLACLLIRVCIQIIGASLFMSAPSDNEHELDESFWSILPFQLHKYIPVAWYLLRIAVSGIIFFFFLTLLKCFIGTQLVVYAEKRYESVQERILINKKRLAEAENAQNALRRGRSQSPYKRIVTNNVGMKPALRLAPYPVHKATVRFVRAPVPHSAHVSSSMRNETPSPQLKSRSVPTTPLSTTQRTIKDIDSNHVAPVPPPPEHPSTDQPPSQQASPMFELHHRTGSDIVIHGMYGDEAVATGSSLEVSSHLSQSNVAADQNQPVPVINTNQQDAVKSAQSTNEAAPSSAASSSKPSRKSADSIYYTEDKGEKSLEPDEEEDWIGPIKVPHPDGPISLENIDRYTLYKSRIP